MKCYFPGFSPALSILVLLFGLSVPGPSRAKPQEIRVGVYENPPKLLTGTDNLPSGILGDLLREIARREGWTLIDVPCQWHGCLQELQAKKIDLLPDVALTAERKQLFDFHKVPALFSWSEIFSPAGKPVTSILDLQDKRIAVLEGSVQESFLQDMLADFGVHATLVPVNSFDTAFQWAATDRADAAASNHFFGERYASHYKLIATPILFQPVSLFYATARGTNADLLKAIDSDLEQWRITPDSPYYKVLERWMASPTKTVIPTWLWWSGGWLLAGLLAVMFGNTLLRRKVLQRTQQLSADIAKREEIESELVRQRGLFHSVVNTIPDLIWLKDAEGVYMACNPLFEDFFGAGEAEIVGKTDYDFVAKDLADSFRASDLRAINLGKPTTNERWVTFSRDGHRALIETTKTPMHDEQGRLIGVLGIGHDITERTRSREALRQSEERYRLAFQTSLDAVNINSLSEGRYIDVNPAFLRVMGYTREEVIGKSSTELGIWANPKDRERLVESLRDEGRCYNLEAQFNRKDGDTIWGLMSASLMDINGEPSILSVTRDMTERKQAEAQMRMAASVFAHSLEGITITDAKNRIVDVNPSFTRITGYTPEEVIGHDPKLLASGRHGIKFYSEMWGSIHRHGSWQGEIWNRRKDGEVYAAMVSISTIRDQEGAMQNYIAVFSDISQIKKHEEELDRIAHYDPLTGVPNRLLLADRLGQAIAHSRRSGKPVAVCYLDLDGFKPVNDQYGHEVGDQLLVRITEHMRRELRDDDTIARLGGDEFVIIFTELSGPEDLPELLGRILQATRRPIVVRGVTHSVSASIGVTLTPPDEADADILLRHADQAMYRAKEAGRNCYHIYDAERDRQIQVRRQRQKRLSDALAAGEFTLYYQPKVNFFTREIIGAEALIRWLHPEEGLLPPGAFLSDIEGGALETAVGEWVIESALRQIETWNAHGLFLTVSVNIGAHHLLLPDFAERLGEKLAAHPDVRPRDLELEILETAALSDVEQAGLTLAACRELGVRFALDDFGTGYSSLAYFRSLPVDVLKIDQSFVRDMLDDPNDMEIVESVVRLAKAFNRTVIAEGVETPEHGALLMKIGCSLGQGYGIARPMPAEDFPGWAADWQSQSD